MSKITELMNKAVGIVEAATRRDRRALELEFLDDRAAFYRKYEEHLRKLPDEDKRLLRGAGNAPQRRTRTETPDEW